MAQKTRAQISSEITSLLADNTTQDITPADVRTVVSDLNDSLMINTSYTRAQLQTLIAGSGVELNSAYTITNAVGATKVIVVYGKTASTISTLALNLTDNTFGNYDIIGDTFTAIVGGSQTLAETLVLGNITDGTDISISDGDKILLDNGAELRKGTSDAGLGGSNGIAEVCSVGYESKWEVGRRYIMSNDGVTIRQSLYNLNVAPTVNDDDTKGYVVGSLWTLDNGVTYRCYDVTTGAAVWAIASSVDYITLNKADWQALISAGAVIPNQQYYVTDAIDGGGLWTTDIGAKFTAGDKYSTILGSVYFVEIQSWGDGISILPDFSTNDMFIYEFNSTLTDVQVSWIVANGLPPNYFFPYTKVRLGCQLVIPSGIGYGFVVESNVWDDATGISLNACRTISISNPSLPCIYDEPTGNAYITLVDAKVSLNAVTLLAGGLVDVVEFPAVPGYFWDITDAIENYTYGTVDYDNLTIDVITNSNGSQWNDNSQCTGATSNIFSSMREIANTSGREFEANKKIQLDITTSTQGDGTMIVYLTGKLRAI